MGKKRELLKGFDTVTPLYVRGGIDKSVEVKGDVITGQWLKPKETVTLNHSALIDALEDFVNLQEINRDTAASFIRSYSITLDCPFQMIETATGKFQRSDVFKDSLARWKYEQGLLRQIWDGRMLSVGRREGVYLTPLNEFDRLRQEPNRRLAVEIGLPRLALQVCLRTIPLRYLRRCKWAGCDMAPRFVANRSRRKYCSKGCFTDGTTDNKDRWEDEKGDTRPSRR